MDRNQIGFIGQQKENTQGEEKVEKQMQEEVNIRFA